MPFTGWCQEYLSGTISNPVIKSYLQKNELTSPLKSTVKHYNSLFLPFMDDFSGSSVYPDTSKWIDNNVFINGQYPEFPVNYGAATFDVLDAKGDLYKNASPFPFIADYLTSYPIRLDSVYDENIGSLRKITPADSIYLSFYYQPQGYGDTPLSFDSLVLEFGYYDTITVFSHIDSVQIYGYEYPDIYVMGYFTPGSILHPPPPCDTSMSFLLTDTLFVDDSIVIPCDSVYVLKNKWVYAWSARGDSLLNFLVDNDVYFKRVMIPITDTFWLRHDFQFRFYNYGSLADITSWQSNTDHWNIDEVYLNIGRNKNDFYSREIRFVQPPESFIQNYYSMPFRQYSQKLQKDTLHIYANNNDSIVHNCYYHYQVYNDQGNIIENFSYSYTGLMDPFDSQNVNDYAPFVKAPMKGFFEYLGSGDVDFRIDQIVGDADFAGIGDTLTFFQHFSNYMAYDDGTAERSYGSSEAGGQFAVKFETVRDDTLRGVQIFFNKVLDNNNDRYFHIGLWNDNNGKPGVLRYEMQNQKPHFMGPNEFYTYVIPDSLTEKLPVGAFYIGIIQTTSDNLNIGFDRNTNTRNRIFYFAENGWVNSSFEGSLMIRPVLGPPITNSTTQTKSVRSELKIFPNPPVNTDIIQLLLPTEASDPKYRKYLSLQLYDLSGRLIYKAPYNEELNTAWLEPGFYIVDIFNEAFTRHYTAKLLITK